MILARSYKQYKERCRKMSRLISMETLENKILKAQENVSKARVRYEEATSELKKLLDKKKALQTDELVKAISISQRSYEDILAYIQSAE